MTGDEGELGNELSLVDVQVRTADTARLYPEVTTLLQPRDRHLVWCGTLALTLIRTSPGRSFGRGTSTIPQTSGFSYLHGSLMASARRSLCGRGLPILGTTSEQGGPAYQIERESHSGEPLPESLHGRGEVIYERHRDVCVSWWVILK